MHKRYKLKGKQLKNKHVFNLIEQDKIIELVKYLRYGFNKQQYKPLGDSLNETKIENITRL